MINRLFKPQDPLAQLEKEKEQLLLAEIDNRALLRAVDEKIAHFKNKQTRTVSTTIVESTVKPKELSVSA